MAWYKNCTEDRQVLTNAMKIWMHNPLNTWTIKETNENNTKYVIQIFYYKSLFSWNLKWPRRMSGQRAGQTTEAVRGAGVRAHIVVHFTT